MLYNRMTTIDKIADVLSHIMVKIKLKQKLNDLSLNVHAEDFFLEVFNFVYGLKYKNANTGNSNEAFIDLIDVTNEMFIQVTTTTDAGKIKNSFKILDDSKYNNYSVYIYYLLEKPNTSSKIKKLIQEKYNIENLSKHQLDMGDLLKSITSLSEGKIEELYNKHFKNIDEAYTDEMSLQNVIEALIIDFKNRTIPFDADFITINTTEKLLLNNISSRVHREITSGFDYCLLISDLPPEISSDLKELTIEKCYRPILIDYLRKIIPYDSLKTMTMADVHGVAKNNNIDFNRVIYDLKDALNKRIYRDTSDLNCDKAIWCIISYYFEICFIGVKE